MTPTASVVHSSRFGVDSVLTALDVVEDGLWAVDHDLVRVDDLRAHHLQVRGLVLVRLQQVVEALLVNLKVVHHQLERCAFFLDRVIHKFKDVADRSRDDTVLTLHLLGDLAALLDHLDHSLRSQHRVSFTCSTHAVGKDRSVKSRSEKFDSFLTRVVIHLLLRRLNEDIVEGVSECVHVGPIISWRARGLDAFVVLIELPLRNLAVREFLPALETDNDLDGVGNFGCCVFLLSLRLTHRPVVQLISKGSIN